MHFQVCCYGISQAAHGQKIIKTKFSVLQNGILHSHKKARYPAMYSNMDETGGLMLNEITQTQNKQMLPVLAHTQKLKTLSSKKKRMEL